MLAIFVKSDNTHDRTSPNDIKVDSYREPNKTSTTPKPFHSILPTIILFARHSWDDGSGKEYRSENPCSRCMLGAAFK